MKNIILLLSTYNEKGSDGFINPTVLLQQMTNDDASTKKSNKYV